MPQRADLEPFLSDIDAARWYTNFGPQLHRFEDEIRGIFGEPAASVSTVANGTFALELALAALGLPRGARVLIPALTFVATASAVLRAGFEPVIADVDAKAWVLTPSIARAVIAKAHVDCVLPVAAFGCPLSASGWDGFCAETGIPVLVDAAGAFGNQQAGDSIVLAFSLHATKAFGVGEGGLVVSRDPSLIERVRRLSNFGIDVSTGLALSAGTNAKMSEFHAAVGLAALARWPERARLRRDLHLRYCDELARRCPGVRLQARPADGIYTILQLVLPANASRDAIAKALSVQGIETRAWYLPLLPDHPACASLASGGIEVARSLGPRMLGLPFHLDLSDEDVVRVCAALAEALD